MAAEHNHEPMLGHKLDCPRCKKEVRAWCRNSCAESHAEMRREYPDGLDGKGWLPPIRTGQRPNRGRR